MANRTPEQDLINEFVTHLEQHADDTVKIGSVINTNCKSKKFADIESALQYGWSPHKHWVSANNSPIEIPEKLEYR